MQSGRRVALVSSGAVGAGMGQLGLATANRSGHLQAVAAVGQTYLVEAYDARSATTAPMPPKSCSPPTISTTAPAI